MTKETDRNFIDEVAERVLVSRSVIACMCDDLDAALRSGCPARIAGDLERFKTIGSRSMDETVTRLLAARRAETT